MRAAFALLGVILLSACGLRPVYSGGAQGVVAQSLQGIAVGPIEGQAGWLVRSKLVDRLGDDRGGPARYRLEVTLDDNLTSFGIRGDRAATRELPTGERGDRAGRA